MKAFPDYFPLKAGLVLEYKTRNASGEGRMKIEVLRVGTFENIVKARVRRTTKWGEEKTQEEYDVLKDGTGVYSNDDPEFPIPPRIGHKWDRYPRDYEITDDKAVAKVPAGTFKDCLKVSYRIGGGDGGFGERFYAPNVGFVREACEDETDPYEFALLRVGEKK